MTPFSSLGLCSELQNQLIQLGYRHETPIQLSAIPLILEGHDIIAQAQTGTGKTAAFALPILHRLKDIEPTEQYHSIKALVLTPTRELAIQVGDKMLSYAEPLGTRVTAIYGGVRFDNQLRKMKRGADVLVATPGRLLDMLGQNKLSLNTLEMLVLDEADRMLDLGFADDLRQLMQYMPKKRQTLLFSATYDENIQLLAQKFLINPHQINVSSGQSTASKVMQRAFAVDSSDKSDILSYLIRECRWSQTLVFTRTKKRADLVTDYLLNEGVTAVALHGDKSQRERNEALKRFSHRDVEVLVATDVAARGLDIENLLQVINYDLPNQPEAYVHRIGRTARAGKKGLAISLVSPEEKRFLLAIAGLIKQELPLEAVPIVEQGKLPVDRKKLSSKTKSKPSASAIGKKKPKTVNSPKKQKSTQASGSEPSPKDKAGRRSLFG